MVLTIFDFFFQTNVELDYFYSVFFITKSIFWNKIFMRLWLL